MELPSVLPFDRKCAIHQSDCVADLLKAVRGAAVVVDRVSTEVRSEIMRSIPGADTKPELLVRSGLHRRGLRFRLHDSTLPGRPDLVLRAHKSVVFVHGCFWHAHPDCRFSRMPKSNREFWRQKRTQNRARDLRVTRALRKMGWRVFVVWQCELRATDRREVRLNWLASRIRRPPPRPLIARACGGGTGFPRPRR